MLRPSGRAVRAGTAILSGAAFAALAAVACTPALAGGQGYDYDIFVGGSQVAEMRVTVEREGAPDSARYRVTSSIGLVGMAAWVSDWTAHSEVEGRFVGGAPMPEHFMSVNRWQDRERSVTVSYVNGAVASVDIVEPPDDDDDDERRAPVSDAQRHGTTDPLTGMLMAFLSPGDCGGDARVYDGRRVTAVQIVSAGKGDAPQTEYGIYHGPATVCTFAMRHVAGHIRRWEEERRGQTEMSVWLANVGDDLAVPVRIESDTEWGALRGHLVGVSVQEAAN